MDEIRIQSNAQHLFHKKQRLSALIHCTSIQWDLSSQHCFNSKKVLLFKDFHTLSPCRSSDLKEINTLN